MKKYNKKANYNANPNYLDFLDALRKFFTKDQDIIPIILDFNFYVNGVYDVPLNDLFRAFEFDGQDYHSTEQLKQFTDDGTIGILRDAIYKIGNGSLIMALENLRVILLNKKEKYNVGYNPMTLTYTEALKTPINVLPDANPEVIEGEIRRAGGGPVVGGTKVSLGPKKKKSFWKYFSFLSYKQKLKK
jgi:hypothetical protein